MPRLRYLLIQIRNPDDPMRQQEVGCFAAALGCSEQYISTFDLLTERLTNERLNTVDAVLIGGSGDYSAAGDSEWLDGALADLRLLCELRKPTFASCWGFQAIARALGGRCIHDPAHAELGTIDMKLTAGGKNDPLFGQLAEEFLVLAGHEDHVVELPPGVILLASSATVANQAFKLIEAPIYCTQFHPELQLSGFLERVMAYPRYVEQIAGIPANEFADQCRDTPESRKLLSGFVNLVQNHKTPADQ